MKIRNKTKQGKVNSIAIIIILIIVGVLVLSFFLNKQTTEETKVEVPKLEQDFKLTLEEEELLSKYDDGLSEALDELDLLN